jgi:single-strand DNA-binding protein
MINRVILVGNLTRDAEAVPTNGKAMTRMRVATNTRWTDGAGTGHEAAEFHSVVTFGSLAEVWALYGSKGRRVYIEGKLRTRDYEGSDGVRRYTTEIVAQTVRLLQSKADNGAASEPAAAVRTQA